MVFVGVDANHRITTAAFCSLIVIPPVEYWLIAHIGEIYEKIYARKKGHHHCCIFFEILVGMQRGAPW